jgi:hypothetical protein
LQQQVENLQMAANARDAAQVREELSARVPQLRDDANWDRVWDQATKLAPGFDSARECLEASTRLLFPDSNQSAASAGSRAVSQARDMGQASGTNGAPTPPRSMGLDEQETYALTMLEAGHSREEVQKALARL